MKDVAARQREDRKTLELSVKGMTSDGRKISLRNTDIDTLTKYLGQWRRLVGKNVDIKLENGYQGYDDCATGAYYGTCGRL